MKQMKIRKTFLALLLGSSCALAQTNPAITSWLQNNTITGRHYVNGNSTPIVDAVIANVQTVQYSTDWVYASTHGIPTYVTGPFLDGNPSLATDQNAIFKFPLNPVQNTGTPTATTGGNIGVFAHRAEIRGASKVISFEPVTPTFNCLIKNRGPKTSVYKNAVGGKNGFTTFRIHTDCNIN
jgi:hypothetical protein